MERENLGLCPKCKIGDICDGPRFYAFIEQNGLRHELLEYQCSVCRYTRRIPCKDAKETA